MSCIRTLKEKGLKLTPQRRLIIDTIHDTVNHLTAEEIITHVQSLFPEVHKSTIYRTLEMLEKTGCVFKSSLSNHTIYHHVDDSHHPHLVCNKCGMTIDCNDDIFLPLEKLFADKYGFKAEFKHMVIRGLCAECKDIK
jgi:Fur family ferric uptake transcriptional regulator